MPVPTLHIRPVTMHDDGDTNFSFCPNKQASLKNAKHVSKVIFCKGDALVLIPIRLNGL